MKIVEHRKWHYLCRKTIKCSHSKLSDILVTAFVKLNPIKKVIFSLLISQATVQAFWEYIEMQLLKKFNTIHTNYVFVHILFLNAAV